MDIDDGDENNESESDENENDESDDSSDDTSDSSDDDNNDNDDDDAPQIPNIIEDETSDEGTNSDGNIDDTAVPELDDDSLSYPSDDDAQGVAAVYTGEGDNDDDDDDTVVYDEVDVERNRQRINIDEGAAVDATESASAPSGEMGSVVTTDGQHRHSARLRKDGVKSKYKRATQHLVYTEKKRAFQMLMKTREAEKQPMDQMRTAMGVLFAQMSAKAGIREFGMRAVAALIKEFTQQTQGAVPGNPVVVPIDPDGLSHEDIKQALEAVNLISEKRSGEIKGRMCANGSKQRQFLHEGETVASPTVSVEGLLTTLLIATYEGRSVVSFDVPGAFLQADMPDDKLVLLVLRGEFVDYMCKVNPDHLPNVQIGKKGKKVLYMRVVKAIYGCIESALQWYKLFKDTLEKDGFELNPYDLCVANKVIDGKQCTIAWYVDDCIVTQMSFVVLKHISDRM